MKILTVTAALVLLALLNFTISGKLENLNWQSGGNKWAYQKDAIIGDVRGNESSAPSEQVQGAKDDIGSTSTGTAEGNSDKGSEKDEAEGDNNESSNDGEKDENGSPSKPEEQPSEVNAADNTRETIELEMQEPQANETMDLSKQEDESSGVNTPESSPLATELAKKESDSDDTLGAPIIDEQILEENRQRAYQEYGLPKDPPLLNSSVPFANFSHIRFYGQAGMGHRLVRNAAAMYQGRLRGLAVRSYWSGPLYENGTKDLFSVMFEPYTREDFTYVNSTNQYSVMWNEVQGADGISMNTGKQIASREARMKKVGKSGLLEGDDCPCTYEEFQVYYDFFVSLRDKYRKRDVVEEFRKKHRFDEHTVIGIHVRAGNGEQGDFTKKGRQLKISPTAFVQAAVGAMLENFGINTTACSTTSARFNFEKYPPLIFLATDDPAYRGYFREALKDVQQNCSSSETTTDSQNGGLGSITWPVVSLEQKLRETGVVLRAGKGDDGVAEWDSMFQDSLLLASADIVIAAMKSSFSQALPAILVMGEPLGERKTEKNGNQFCEIIGGTMNCHDHLMKWCCQTSKLVHKNVWKFHKKEYRGTAKPKLEMKPFEPENYLSFEHTVKLPK